MIKGTKSKPKKIVIVDDIFSISAFDTGINILTAGNKQPGGYVDVGNNVHVYVVGCVDGRFLDSPTPATMPVNSQTRLVKDGAPVSPVNFTAAVSHDFWAWNENNMSGYDQHDNIRPYKKPLPISFEKNVYEDMGYLPSTRDPINGWTRPPPNPSNPFTWRYFYLEKGLEVALK